MVGNRSSQETLEALTESIVAQEEKLRHGGGPTGHARQQKLGRLPVRERLNRLLDDPSHWLEMGLWAGFEMYPQWGEVPAAGVVTGIGHICGRPCMVIANDASVKAGAFFPATVKKVLRAQRIAFLCKLPLVYLVDSSGVFLPLQDEIFPDEDDFGRIFRNNAVLSAAGVPQYAAIMGNCVAGGAYLPVLCDKVLMTEGSELYLAGPSLVKAAIGQVVDADELGGAKLHAQISGTVDFREPDDDACLARLRSLIGLLPDDHPSVHRPLAAESQPAREPAEVYTMVSADGRKEYDVRCVLECIVDAGSLEEYKAEYGKVLVNAYARIGGRAVGIVANQRMRCTSSTGELQIGSVLYPDSVEKSARFIMDCNQSKLPIVFFQDVVGFMVGRDAERSGIIRSGAKLVNVVSNSVVPKVTVIIGGSFGAGNYALCGKAFDPTFIFAWPSAKYAVMGPHQAADTLLSVQTRIAERQGTQLSDTELKAMHAKIKQQYEEQSDIRYGAARGWVDAILAPSATREVLIAVLGLVGSGGGPADFHTGVLQV